MKNEKEFVDELKKLLDKHTNTTWYPVSRMIKIENDDIPDIASFNPELFDQSHLKKRSDEEVLANTKLAALAPEMARKIISDYDQSNNWSAQADQEYIVESLLSQKKANDLMVDELSRLNDIYQNKLAEKGEETYIQYLFFVEKHPELIPEFVELVYSEFYSPLAKKIVAAFHDKAIDLTTIECTGNDFEPWE